MGDKWDDDLSFLNEGLLSVFKFNCEYICFLLHNSNYTFFLLVALIFFKTISQLI